MLLLISRRDQLLGMRAQEQNRLETSDCELSRWIKKNIRQLSLQLQALEGAIAKVIKQSAEIQHTLSLYSSIPGVGKLTALQLIVDLPELVGGDDKTLAALVGLAPWNQDSGTKQGHRRTRGGRTRVRTLLYMSALSAARCHPQLKVFYKKLRDKRKAAKVALVAVAHKLLMILRSVAQRQTPWVTILSR